MDNSSFVNIDNIEKFIFVNSNNQIILLGKFIVKAMRHRTELLYNLLTDVLYFVRYQVNSIVTDGTFNAISFISGADIEKRNKRKVI